MSNIDDIKKLREDTGLSVIECQKALKEANGNLERAKEILKEWGKQVAQKKNTRETKQGIVDSYIHGGGRVGVMIKLRCETDFVAKSNDFRNLSHEICLQIAAISTEETPLLEQPWIKDQSKTVKNLVEDYIAKLGENIVLDELVRYEL